MTVSAGLIAAVLLISLLLTMVGLGGGLIFSPLFVVLGMTKTAAASASLFLNLVAAGSAAWAYARSKMVDFTVSVPLIAASAAAAPVGAWLNAAISLQPFLALMAGVLFLAGIRMLLPTPAAAENGGISPLARALGGIVIGGIIGLLGGLLGIGGGVFVVPLLIYVLKVPTKIAAASSTFIVCFSSLTGFLGYASLDAVQWGFILPAAAASFVGGQLGARIMSTRIQPKTIRIAFSFILFALCARLLYQFVITL